MITLIGKRRGTNIALDNHLDSINWVLRARGRQYEAVETKILHVEDGIMVSTDGYRMHTYRPIYDELPAEAMVPDGNYQIITYNEKLIVLEKANLVNYPPYKKIIKAGEKEPYKYYFTVPFKEVAKRDIFNQLVAELYRVYGNTFRLEHLKQAYDGLQDDVGIKWIREKTLVMRDSQRAAYIEPMACYTLLKQEEGPKNEGGDER